MQEKAETKVKLTTGADERRPEIISAADERPENPPAVPDVPVPVAQKQPSRRLPSDWRKQLCAFGMYGLPAVIVVLALLSASSCDYSLTKIRQAKTAQEVLAVVTDFNQQMYGSMSGFLGMRASSSDISKRKKEILAEAELKFAEMGPRIIGELITPQSAPSSEYAMVVTNRFLARYGDLSASRVLNDAKSRHMVDSDTADRLLYIGMPAIDRVMSMLESKEQTTRRFGADVMSAFLERPRPRPQTQDALYSIEFTDPEYSAFRLNAQYQARIEAMMARSLPEYDRRSLVWLLGFSEPNAQLITRLGSIINDDAERPLVRGEAAASIANLYCRPGGLKLNQTRDSNLSHLAAQCRRMLDTAKHKYSESSKIEMVEMIIEAADEVHSTPPTVKRIQILE